MAIIEWMQANPRISILLLSFVISLFITLINYLVMDKTKMKELKERQKRIQNDMKAHAGNADKQKELMREMMSSTGETFRHSFKPMLITIIPVIIAFSWIKGVYAETIIAKSWLWYYLGGAIVSSIIFRKIFKLP